MPSAAEPKAPTPPADVFVSYSRKDKGWRDQLDKHLTPAVRSGSIVLWDEPLAEGQFPARILGSSSGAGVLVLLLTPDYLASPSIIREDLVLLDLRRQEGMEIVPVLVKPIDLKSAGWLHGLDLFPDATDAISLYSPAEHEEIFSDLAKLIEARAAGIVVPPSSETPRTTRARPGSEQQDTKSKPSIRDLSAFALSNEAEQILRRARVLATFAGPGPRLRRVSTSCLLFAIAEGGRDKSQFFRTPQFLWKELRRKGAKPYTTVFTQKFPNARYSSSDATIDFESFDDLAEEVTPNVLKVFDRASDISRLTLAQAQSKRVSGYRERVPGDELFPGHIGARHLLAALLVLHFDGGPVIGVMSRLEKMIGDTAPLRKRFLAFIVKNLPDDDHEAWRGILLPGEPDESVNQKEDREEEPGPPIDHTPEPDKDFRAPVAGFLTDSWFGKDLLDITPDVNALASLVAAWSVEPPLSIGLFGDWGSGKTHFMKQMKARVDRLSLEARQSAEPQNKIGYYKNIVQIEFNAWHYIEGNLWASLVEHIFRNLRMSEEDDDAILKERQENLLQDLLGEEVAERAASQALKSAEEKVTDKKEEIRGIEQKQKESTDALAELSKKDILAGVQLSVALDTGTQAAVDEALKAAGVDRAGSAARDFQAALTEARAVFGRAGGLLTPILKAQDGKKRFKMLLLILLGAPILGLAIGLLVKRFGSEISSLSAILTSAATLMTTGAYWIRQQMSWVSNWSQKVEEARQKVDKQVDTQIAEERAKYAEQIAGHEQALRTLQTNLDAALRERDAAQRRVQRVQDEIKQTAVVERLGRFIQDRAASDDYRKHLGVLALIRRDFERLTKLFSKLREEEQTGKAAQGSQTINRIILYIDDLDRCPPERVVQVLQAIHLLLAFKLFIVVVGVDARWVTRSLQENYEWLRSEDDEGNGNKDERNEPGNAQGPTAHDYLEKIFQIPFWLKPMGVEECKGLLDGLTKDSRAKKAEENGPPVAPVKDEPTVDEAKSKDAEIAEAGSEAVAVTQRGEPQPIELASPPVETPAAVGIPIGDQTGVAANAGEVLASTGNASAETPTETPRKQSSDDKEGEDKIDLAPLSLTLTDEEITYMKELTPLIGRSPRAVKRFLNCYRLIKVSYASRLTKLIGADGQSGEYREVMILLGVITGGPSVALYFVEELEKRMQAGKVISLHEFVSLLDKNPDINAQPDWLRVKRFLETHVTKENSEGVLKGLLGVAPRVSRYSFRVARAEAAGQKRRPSTPKIAGPAAQKPKPAAR